MIPYSVAPHSFPPVFEDRVAMRRAEERDAESIFEEYASDREAVRFVTWRPPSEVRAVKEFLRSAADGWDRGDYLSWVLAEVANGRAIGMITCRLGAHGANIGYVLARRLWNRGIMTEAVSRIVSWASSQKEIYRIWAVCDVENTASVRVLEKAGMSREGLLRRWVIHPSLSSEPRDCFVYSQVK